MCCRTNIKTKEEAAHLKQYSC